MLSLAAALPAGTLISIVLAVITVELVVLLVLRLQQARRAPRQVPGLAAVMLPGAAAGLFLALALNDLQRQGGRWLPLWLAAAGAAHALDWWQRARRARR
jgi:hypothetical protein